MPLAARPVTSPQVDRQAGLASAVLIYWHLLSLDAPTVAALWTLFVARAAGVALSWSSPTAVFLAVWILYAADRLLDARVLAVEPTDPTLEARHLFHYRHRRLFRLTILLAALALIPLLLALPPADIRLYLTLGALLLAWLLLIHLPTDSLRRLPKEAALGFFFAAATFIPAVGRLPALRPLLLAPALLLALLCSLNCLYIYRWEHPLTGRSDDPPHPTTAFSLRHLYALTLALIAASLTAAALLPRSMAMLPLATALAALLLLLLDRYPAGRPTLLRALADLALLTPILFLLH